MATDCHVCASRCGTPARSRTPDKAWGVAIRLGARLPYLSQPVVEIDDYGIGLHATAGGRRASGTRNRPSWSPRRPRRTAAGRASNHGLGRLARSAWARRCESGRGCRAPWAAWDDRRGPRATARAAAPGPFTFVKTPRCGSPSDAVAPSWSRSPRVDPLHRRWQTVASLSSPNTAASQLRLRAPSASPVRITIHSGQPRPLSPGQYSPVDPCYAASPCSAGGREAPACRALCSPSDGT